MVRVLPAAGRLVVIAAAFLLLILALTLGAAAWSSAAGVPAASIVGEVPTGQAGMLGTIAFFGLALLLGRALSIREERHLRRQA